MSLKLTKALEPFHLADTVELNCGEFDIIIRQAAIHNEEFRAAVTKRTLETKKRSVVPDKGTLTGNFEEDVKLICDFVIVGWGKRPLKDDDGNLVEPTKENFFDLFTKHGKPGKVLFGKIMTGSASDDLFILREEDAKNS